MINSKICPFDLKIIYFCRGDLQVISHSKLIIIANIVYLTIHDAHRFVLLSVLIEFLLNAHLDEGPIFPRGQALFKIDLHKAVPTGHAQIEYPSDPGLRATRI